MAVDNLSGTLLHTSDVVVMVIYFTSILVIGLVASCRNRGSVGGYFLAGRDMHWLLVGCSLFASNVGSLHFVGLAGSGAKDGISVGIFEINAIFVVMMLGWLFLPVYIASGIYTMPDYIKKRFGGQRIRIYLAVLSLLLYIFTKISADLYAGAIFIDVALQWDMYAAVLLILAIAAVFTITGGLTAVIWTDFVQTIIMVIGAIALSVISFSEVGGFEGMRFKYAHAVAHGNDSYYSNTTCGHPRADFLHLMRASDADIPWSGVFGVIINSVWYWCADQVIVQRTLAAKTFSHAKAGCITCGYLKMLPLFILVFPGMIARILYTEEVGCVDPAVCEAVCGSPSGCSNRAYPLLVLRLLPAGARGVMLSVMLAALMSSLSSIFNSSATIFSIDIWRRIRRRATDRELQVVGRLCVLVLVGVSIAWLPVIRASQGSELFTYIQQVSSFLTPPVSTVFVMAIFWARLTEPGAFWSLVVGLVLGVTRFVLEFVYTKPLCPLPDMRPWIVRDFTHLYFSVFLAGVTAVVAAVISLRGDPIPSHHLYRLTFWTRHSLKPRIDIDTDNVLEEDVTGVEKTESIIVPNSQPEKLPLWKRLGQWVCGIEETHQVEQTAEGIAALTSLKEQTTWKRLVGVNAIICMTAATFFWGFFA